MWKTGKKTILLTFILTLLPVVVGLLLWDRLPPEIPTHFGSNNQPDGWSSKAFAVFALPGIMAGVHLLCVLCTNIDPKKDNITPKIMTVVLWFVPVLSWVVMGIVYFYALGRTPDVDVITSLMVGLLLIIVGNYLPKVKQNYTVGIKVSWALNDEENWRHTHRFAGYVFIIAGILVAVLGLLHCLWAVIAVALITAFAPVVYSYCYYRKHN